MHAMSRRRVRRKLPGDVKFPHVRSFWAAVMLVIGLMLIFSAMADPQSGIIAPPTPIARLSLLLLIAVAVLLIFSDLRHP